MAEPCSASMVASCGGARSLAERAKPESRAGDKAGARGRTGRPMLSWVKAPLDAQEEHDPRPVKKEVTMNDTTTTAAPAPRNMAMRVLLMLLMCVAFHITAWVLVFVAL